MTLDLKKELKHLYKPSTKTVSVVEVPPMNYLMINGEGNPNTSQQYKQAISTLYALAYGIRAICKVEDKTFTVMPLEGLWWWHENPEEVRPLNSSDKDQFLWTMMILQPDFVTADMVEAARKTVHKKKKNPPYLDDIRFDTYHENLAVQIMHVGSYDDEAPTIKKLHEYIVEQGYKFAKKHHEIYLSNPDRVSSDKLKTIIRQPFVTTS